MLTRAEEPGLVRSSIPICKLDTPQLDVTSTATRRPIWASRSRPRPHARDAARRPPGHALQARGEQYDVIVKVRRSRPPNPDRSRRIYVRGRGDAWCRCRTWSASRRPCPEGAQPFNQLRSATITAQLAPGYTLGEASTFWRRRPRRCSRPPRNRLCRPVARVQADELEHLFHLRARARLHLSRARRAVRELQAIPSSSC